MSLYVQWINLIKEKATLEWLTDSQRATYDRILSQWLGAPFVNLCGPPGCGKSFIARLLSKYEGYIYTQDLQTVEHGVANAVLDNAQYTRTMRPTVSLIEIGRVILVTRRRVSDPMSVAEIDLTEKDVRQFLHNLYTQCGISFTATKPEGTDLARILRAEVIAKGG
jgi:ABC-type cobalamin/Fe3+-siderophores transport system ATPase subunit